MAGIRLSVMCLKLKADQLHPHDYSTHRQTPWTDNDFSLLFAALSKAEPLISTAARQKLTLTLTHDLDPDLWPWPWPLTLTLKQGNIEVQTQFLAFDLWPTTLTYNPNLAKVKVDPIPKIKVVGQTVQPWEVGQTDGWMDRQADRQMDGWTWSPSLRGR